jgi:starch synthase
MHIIHVASELNPIAKVGGLADVVYGLSKQLVKSGHSVEIILPKYDTIDYNILKKLKVEFRELWSYEGPYLFNNTFWSAELENLKIILLETHHPNYYYNRGVIYGCADDNDRFIYFARATMEYLYKSGKRPDILHLHDWPTAIMAPLYKEMYIPLGLHIGGIVLTIHNLEHQGKCAPFNLTKAGLQGENYLTPDTMQDPYIKQNINLLKGGIIYADAITTVSPTYEQEIKTTAGGCGLDKTLNKYSSKIKGILNGIDEDFWNPAIDSHLIETFETHKHDSVEKMQAVLNAKEKNRNQIRMQHGLRLENTPLVISITRLVPQKGPELIRHAILRTLEKEGQFILLGSAPDPDTYNHFIEIKNSHPKRHNLVLCFDKDEAFAHLLFAAADMIIVPSLFEPCGLTQMIALRYGTVPIVRATGGLSDTVFDIDTSDRPRNKRNGYTFNFPDAEGVNWALDRALKCFEEDKQKWHTLMQQGMNYDFSWAHETPAYISIYKKITSSQSPSE